MQTLSLDQKLWAVSRRLAEAQKAFLAFIFRIEDVASDFHSCNVIAFLDRMCCNIDVPTHTISLRVHAQVAFLGLAAGDEDFVQWALIVANKLIVLMDILVVLIEDLHFDYLVSLELVVHRENLLEARVLLILYRLCPADLLPLLVLLGFDVDDGVWVTFTICKVKIDQVLAGYHDLDFVWTVNVVHGLCVLHHLVLPHDNC